MQTKNKTKILQILNTSINEQWQKVNKESTFVDLDKEPLVFQPDNFFYYLEKEPNGDELKAEFTKLIHTDTKTKPTISDIFTFHVAINTLKQESLELINSKINQISLLYDNIINIRDLGVSDGDYEPSVYDDEHSNRYESIHSCNKSSSLYLLAYYDHEHTIRLVSNAIILELLNNLK